MYLICHVTSGKHFIDRACEFMGGNSLCYITMPISLVTIGVVMVRYVFHLSCDIL